MAYLHFFSSLTSTLTAIAIGGGYISLFLLMFLEAIPFIGVIIPGHVAIIGAGFLSSIGVLNVYIVAIIGVVGAILGDYASFLLGRRFGWSFFDRLRRYFFVRDSHVEKAKKLLSTHTGKALIFGRFNPVTRGIMPFLVGASHTPSDSFWVYNIIGSVSWVLLSIIIGYVLGLGYHTAAAWIGKLSVAAIIVAILIIWGYRFVNVRFHVFRRYELFALILNIFSLYVLARTIQDATSAVPFLASFDVWVHSLALNLQAGYYSPTILSGAEWVSALGGMAAIAIYAVGTSIPLSFRRKWRSVAIMLLSVGSTAFAVGWIKEIVGRTRPIDLIVPAMPNFLGFLSDSASSIASDPSFPSGHAAFAAAFFVILAYLFSFRIHSWVKRELLMAGCVLILITVGLSRLVMNVHWASDVIAGWALGIFCATISIILVRYLGALVMGKSGD